MKAFKIFLLAFALLFSVDAAMAQNTNKEERKLERAEKKRLKKEAREKRQQEILSLIEDQTFVLEAYSIFNRYMDRYEVPPSTNFIQIAGDQLTLQTGSNFRMGYNGVGGVTLEGIIRDYEVVPAKNGKGASVRMEFSNPVMGHTIMNMHVGSDGTARARVVDGWGRRMTFQGQMVALEDSRVYKAGPAI